MPPENELGMEEAARPRGNSPPLFSETLGIRLIQKNTFGTINSLDFVINVILSKFLM